MVKGTPKLSSQAIKSPILVGTNAELQDLWRAPYSLENREENSSDGRMLFITLYRLFLFRFGWIEKAFQWQGVYVSKLSVCLAHPECLCLKPKRKVNGTESLNPLPSKHRPSDNSLS